MLSDNEIKFGVSVIFNAGQNKTFKIITHSFIFKKNWNNMKMSVIPIKYISMIDIVKIIIFKLFDPSFCNVCKFKKEMVLQFTILYTCPVRICIEKESTFLILCTEIVLFLIIEESYRISKNAM